MAWLGSWAKRIEITIDNTNIDSDLTHFPVPIVLGTSVGQDDDNDVSCVFDELGSDANRKKIAITKADGTTEIYAEIELWDDANERAVLWVSKSDFTITSASTTTLYLYYDSSQDDNTTYIGDIGDVAAQNVWDSDFLAVWHMKDATTTTIVDSTGNSRTLTKKAEDEPLQVDGAVGYAQQFDGSNDYCTVPHETALDFSDTFTIEGLFKPTNLTQSNKYFLGKGNAKSLIWEYTNNSTEFFSNSYSGTNPRTGTQAVLAVEWNYLAYAYDGSQWTCVKNDSIFLDQARSFALSSSSYDWYFGQSAGGSGITAASYDEWRFSSVKRSNAYLKANYYALNDNLISWGSEDLGGPTLAIDSANNITKSSATITGWLINLATHASLDLYYEWGKTTSYGSTTTPETKTEPVTLSANLSGLERNQVYHFRLVAEAGEDTWYSDDASFYTLPASPVPQLKPSGGTFITNPFKGRQQGSFAGDINYLNNKPYYNLKDSVKDFYTKPVRYLVNSNQVESAFEKPYLDLEYPQMHLNLPLQDWPIDPWPEPRPNPLPPGGGGGVHDTCLACNLVGSGHHTAKCGNEIVGLIHIFPIRFCTSFPYTNEDCQLVIETLDGGIISEMPGMFGWNISRYIIVTPLIERHTIRATFTDGTGNVCTAEVIQKCDQTDCCTLFPDGMFTGFDKENSAETIGYESPATLYVLGG